MLCHDIVTFNVVVFVLFEIIISCCTASKSATARREEGLAGESYLLFLVVQCQCYSRGAIWEIELSQQMFFIVMYYLY